MSIHKIEKLDANRLTIVKGDKTTVAEGFRVFLDASRSVEGHKTDAVAKVAPKDRKRVVVLAAQMTADLQDAIDEPYMRVADLPLDDPDRTTDPARPEQFWKDIGGVTWLVGRTAAVEVFHDGVQFQIRQQAT